MIPPWLLRTVRKVRLTRLATEGVERMVLTLRSRGVLVTEDEVVDAAVRLARVDEVQMLIQKDLSEVAEYP